MSAAFIEPASFTEPDIDASDICEECGARTEHDGDAVDGLCGGCAAKTTRTLWWFNCPGEDCGATMLIYPHPDNERDLPKEDDWEDPPVFMDCPVCGQSMDWGGTDHPADLINNYPRRTA